MALDRELMTTVATGADIYEKAGIPFSFEIDSKQLPRPFLIGQAGNSDWTLTTSLIEPIPAKPQP